MLVVDSSNTQNQRVFGTTKLFRRHPVSKTRHPTQTIFPIMHPTQQHLLLLLFTALLTPPILALHSPHDLSRILRRDTCGSDITSQCTTSLQDCVNAICSTCQDVPGIAQCCALTTDDLISECIENSEQGATQSSIPAGASTSSSAIPASLSSELASPDATACVNFESAFDACTVMTPGFSAQPFATKASCLCYESSSWAPNVYDGLWSSCLAFYSTYSSVLYSSLVDESGFVGFEPCSSVGDVVASSPATVSATTTHLSSTSVASPTSPSYVGGTTYPVSPSTTTTNPVATETGTSESSTIGAKMLYTLVAVVVVMLLLV